ncbi:MAG: glycosyl transferase, partial [Campylobacterota bacterium]|nr:glycosyl transferase [Campylobacterota bacterium]
MIYILLLILSFTLTYYIKNYYIKNAILEEVNERSSHTVPTPHGGGIAIAITWFIGLVFLYINNQIDSNLFYPLMIGIIISVVSFFDDIYELSAKLRLGVQSGVAIFGLFALGG